MAGNTEGFFSVYDVASGISEAIDYISTELNNHHQKVAYISYSIAKEMNIPYDEINDIVLGAMLHDIGVFSLEERKKVIYSFFNDNDFDHHQKMGYKLLKDFDPYQNAAELIKHHHAHYDLSLDEVPIGSYIIHLADRLTILFDYNDEILKQVPNIMDSIDKNREMFHPDTVSALHEIAKMEYFWIETFSIPYKDVLSEKLHYPKIAMDLDVLRSLAKVISKIVDFRSSFTATHSNGVAAVAKELTAISGFSERECRLMEIAGYFHDLGKLGISNDILEKRGALDYEEFNEMRKHPYYTYSILSEIEGFEDIAKWAAFHHERLDGNGYPFHIKGDDFSKLARIMAVADIVTAITEDRPYRLGMDSDKALEILEGMVDSGEIDKGTVDIVKDNFTRINEIRVSAQNEELEEYISFYQGAIDLA